MSFFENILDEMRTKFQFQFVQSGDLESRTSLYEMTDIKHSIFFSEYHMSIFCHHSILKHSNDIPELFFKKLSLKNKEKNSNENILFLIWT